jgi:uncharacterized protein
MAFLRKKSSTFEVQVQETVMRVTAPPDLAEECRALALQFWDQLQSYGARDHRFRASRSAVEVPEDAPALIRHVAETAALAGVGPSFTFQGAMIDHVGTFLAGKVAELVVSTGGNYFIVPRKRTKLTVFHGDEMGDGLALVVDPARGPLGVFTTYGRSNVPKDLEHGLVVTASSCCLADAAGAHALGILAKPDSVREALAYLQGVEGVRGAIVIGADGIGLAGGVEIAA